jgi:hypothetical protein
LVPSLEGSGLGLRLMEEEELTQRYTGKAQRTTEKKGRNFLK